MLHTKFHRNCIINEDFYNLGVEWGKGGEEAPFAFFFVQFCIIFNQYSYIDFSYKIS